MDHVNIILLSKADAEGWVPFGENDIKYEIQKVWKEIIKGSPQFRDNFDNLKLDECNCYYPKNRPVHKKLLVHNSGCAFDLDNANDGNVHLENELKNMPDSVEICFVSKQNIKLCKICRKHNYYERTIYEANSECTIVDYLGMILISLGKKASPEFGQETENELKKEKRKRQRALEVKSRKAPQT